MSADHQPLGARLRSAFDRAQQYQVQPEFRANLTARLQAEAAATGLSTSATAGPRRPSLAIAAGIVLVVGIGAGVQGWLTAGRFSALARLAAGDHQNCAIKFALDEKPISLAEAATRYDPAFGRLQNVVPAESTLAAGRIRVLERHSCVFRGRPFAHLVMAYKDQLVSVLVADDGAVGNEWWRGVAARELPSAGEFQMASFRNTAHVVFVVSSLPAADVRAVALAVEGPVRAALAGG
ncbi:MAG: hypothetical protein ACRD2N_11935 [Vicinamibacterales bacterium]